MITAKKLWRRGMGLLPHTLLGRSLLILTLPIVLIQLITMAVFLDRHWGEMTGRLAAALAGEVAWVADALDDGAQAPFLFERASRDFGFTCTLTPTKRLNPDPPEPRFFWEALVHQALEDALKNALGNRKFTVSVNLKTKILHIDVRTQKGILTIESGTGRVFSSSAYIFLMWVMGSALTLGLVAVLFMRGQIRPIKRLAIAARNLGLGREVAPFAPSGAMEVRGATRAFFEMQARIKRYIDQRTQMLAGVSHDLGTLLTRLKLTIALLPDGPDTQDLKADVEEMTRMLAAYLDFARGAGAEAFVRTDITALIHNAIERLGARVPVDVHIQGDVTARLRPLAMARALANLMSNAVRYGTHIWVSAHVENSFVDIRIEDNGPGIPPEKYKDAFRPFVRLDLARTLDGEGGTGLGLAIVQDIAHAHGGEVLLEASPHGGLCAILRLPV